MSDLELYNHPTFRDAAYAVHAVERMLMDDCNLSLEEARKWIQTWASGAGDGSE